MKKKIWLTALEKNEAEAKKLFDTLSKYGLAVEGHFWEDDLEKMSWSMALEEIVQGGAVLWAILATPESLAAESIRYGLSMLALGLHHAKGHGFPVFLLVQGDGVKEEELPTPLRGAQVMKAGDATLGAKLAAQANMPLKKGAAEYRLKVYGVPGLGEWWEVGPGPGQSWKGVMFGVADGEIASHGIGPADQIPERCVLEYPMKGMKLEMGGREYVAWAVQNALDEKTSYYLGVRGHPASVVFGPLAEGEDAEVFSLKLK